MPGCCAPTGRYGYSYSDTPLPKRGGALPRQMIWAMAGCYKHGTSTGFSYCAYNQALVMLVACGLVGL